MFDHDAVYALVGGGWICWTLGGGGHKWIRRWLWPAILVSVAVLSGVAWWRGLLSYGCLALSLTLGYSPQRTSRAQRVAIASCYGLALFPMIGWRSLWAALLTTGVFNGSMELSHSRLGHIFVHKYTEGLTGAVQGWVVAAWLLR